MSKRIIAFTGAGISRESGIPTFEDMGDLRTKLSRDFANEHSEEYKQMIRKMKEVVDIANPNDAHIALAEYGVPIITMNIDGLHKKAGSENVIEVHGTLPTDEELDYCDELYEKPVLYGDTARLYSKAFLLIANCDKGDTLLIIGASHYSGISDEIRFFAYENGLKIVEIQDNASTKVREFLENFFKANN